MGGDTVGAVSSLTVLCEGVVCVCIVQGVDVGFFEYISIVNFESWHSLQETRSLYGCRVRSGCLVVVDILLLEQSAVVCHSEMCCSVILLH